MTAPDLLAADRARRAALVSALELQRLRALTLGPAASEALESIDRQLTTERIELEAHEC